MNRPKAEPEMEVNVEIDAFEDGDQRLRWWIIVEMADPSMTSDILMPRMDAVYQWLKSGEMPKTPPKLKAV